MTKLVFKTKPRPYQVPALKLLLRNGGGGLYVPMRWGKSWLAINAAAGLHLKEGIQRVLIVCPNDVVEEWYDQIQKHCPVPYTLMIDGLFLLNEQVVSDGSLQFHIRNYEAMWARIRDDPGNSKSWSAVTDKQLIQWLPELVVVDEAHHIGNPSTLTSKKVNQVARLSKHRIFLTGTPFHRKPFYVFGQFKFYDPSVFGENFGTFKRQVAVFGGYMGYEVKRYRNLRWLKKKIKPHVFVAERVPKNPPVFKHYKFGLEESADYYQKMLRESIITVGDEEITAPIALTRYLRLAQIAGGWVRTESGRYRRVGSEKKRAFTRRMVEYQEQGIDKLVVGARFIPELVDIRDVVKGCGYTPLLVHGGVPRERRAQLRKFFHNTEKPTAFIAQFKASREGVDLSAADLMVYYSLPEDYLTYDQFGKRIELYDEKRTLLYEHLIGRNTVEVAAYEAISRQEDVAKYILKNPRLVEELTART